MIAPLREASVDSLMPKMTPWTQWQQSEGITVLIPLADTELNQS